MGLCHAEIAKIDLKISIFFRKYNLKNFITHVQTYTSKHNTILSVYKVPTLIQKCKVLQYIM